MYKLKNVAKRSSALLGAVGLLTGIGTSALPAFASANDLNPLTERSLTLSSSSPGWAFTDGSGNSTYAPPNSGANGQKTGNYFSFKVSTDSTPSGTNNPIKAMSFQYCTGSAGNCTAPGNDATHGVDTATTSDLNVHYTGAAEVTNSDDAQTGTITLTSGSNAVVGTGTSFTTTLKAGETFKTAGGNTYTIASVTNNTQLTITTNAVATENGSGSGVAFTVNNFAQVVDSSTGLVKAVPGYVNNNPKYQAQGGKGDLAEAAKFVAGNFIVMYYNGTAWVESYGWTASTSNQEEATSGTTGQQNTIILQHSTGLGLASGTQMKVLFFARTNDYITNPGAGAFFVKINTFKNFQALAGPVPGPANTLANNIARLPSDVIDGGVTVANVMNQSIQITTKVLETMQFSVGTVDPDTLDDTQLAASDYGAATHNKSCATIMRRMTPTDQENVLQLGDQSQESSLSTDNTYATHSYWRLSSNSSAGATVYYSGHTLSNTSGDEITPIGTTASVSSTGAEQFGLALDTTAYAGGNGFDDATRGVDYRTAAAGGFENAADNAAAGVVRANSTNNAIKGVDDSTLTDRGATGTPPSNFTGLAKDFHMPKLDPLVPTGNSGTGLNYYGGGSGTIVNNGTAKFAFDPMSDTIPAPLATENNQVVDCVTGKMRYIANIAATTPAGIYTTKVNYIAAPQY